ncbi:5350_t:CDS:10 [Paraglomus occultum]|uniref:5350_t:CDS:1 n=1 Tax=Paraglomus occultum TaxID=144539 RepID=A0A9N9ADJ5_9GLOM|nr:5350_t:CDS:10 [Paraglomus occultum]
MSWQQTGGAPQYGQRPLYSGSPQRPPPYQAPPFGGRPPAPPFASQTFVSNPHSSVWTEHTSADGRRYYYNTLTKQSSWDKPEELKTPEERALGTCQWKEFTADGGRKYYYHAGTKETTWDMPAEYKEFLETLEKEKKPASPLDPSTQINGAGASFPNQQDMEKARRLSTPGVSPVNVTPLSISVRPSGVAAPVVGPNVPIVTPVQKIEVEFETKEEAQAAFRRLLKESGVTPDWSWEQTMRAVITKPMYKALKTLSERKQAYQDYIDELRRKEEEEKKAKIAKTRAEFIELLETRPEINSSTRYRKICEIFAQEPAFMAVEDERQREKMFNDYIYELRKQEKEAARSKRKENMDKFSRLLRSLSNIGMTTRWKDAQQIYSSTPEYQSDESLQRMDMLDFLAVYEEHIKSLEREYNLKKSKMADAKKRRERKNRSMFRELLEELKQKGVITAKSKWSEIYPLIDTDERYLNMLGQPGSSPLELFWDVVEELDEILYQQKKMVMDVMKKMNITVGPSLPLAEFMATVKSDERCSGLSDVNLKIIYEQSLKKQEKKQRKKMEAFRSILKHFEQMFNPDITWTQVRPILEKTEEFQALNEEEQRIEVFNKFKDRLKEKHTRKDQAESDDEEGTLKDEEYDETRHSSSDRKRKHKSQRYHHRREHHHSDYSGDSEHSDRERDSDKRKRRKKTSKHDDHHYTDRYSDSHYTRHSDSRHSDSRNDSHYYDSRHSTSSPRTENYRNKNEADNKNGVMGSRDESKENKEGKEGKETRVDKKEKEEEELPVHIKHDDSSAEEGEYVE